MLGVLSVIVRYLNTLFPISKRFPLKYDYLTFVKVLGSPECSSCLFEDVVYMPVATGLCVSVLTVACLES